MQNSTKSFRKHCHKVRHFDLKNLAGPVKCFIAKVWINSTHFVYFIEITLRVGMKSINKKEGENI